MSQAEKLAQLFHETYERLAPDFGYKTREASAKPWAEVPDQNKQLMIAVCGEIHNATKAELDELRTLFAMEVIKAKLQAAELEHTDKTLKALSKSYVELSHGTAQQAVELERVKQSHEVLKECVECLDRLKYQQNTDGDEYIDDDVLDLIAKAKQAIANAEKVVGNE